MLPPAVRHAAATLASAIFVVSPPRVVATPCRCLLIRLRHVAIILLPLAPLPLYTLLLAPC